MIAQLTSHLLSIEGDLGENERVVVWLLVMFTRTITKPWTDDGVSGPYYLKLSKGVGVSSLEAGTGSKSLAFFGGGSNASVGSIHRTTDSPFNTVSFSISKPHTVEGRVLHL